MFYQDKLSRLKNNGGQLLGLLIYLTNSVALSIMPVSFKVRPKYKAALYTILGNIVSIRVTEKPFSCSMTRTWGVLC
jgi:hypothetical protein